MMLSGIVVLIVLVVITGLASVVKQDSREEAGNVVLKLIYTLLLGIFLAVFVGVGISAFYPGPKYPEQPISIKYGSPEMNKDCSMSEDYKKEIEEFNKIEKSYQKSSNKYNRDVSIISVFASILIVFISLTLFKTILIIADGLLLGGVLTLIYGVMRGFGTEDNMFRFIVVSVGLIVSLVLGYIKFIKPAKKSAE